MNGSIVIKTRKSGRMVSCYIMDEIEQVVMFRWESVARNKKPESIELMAKAGFEHTRNVLPLQTQFDCGSEGVKMQELMWGNIGETSVWTGPSVRNIVIEGWWRILHNGVIWIYRLELYYLQSVQLLDTLNPVHISSLWWSHSHHIQDSIDEFTSHYNGKIINAMKKYGKQAKCPKFVFQSLFRDLSGANWMNVYEPNTQSDDYDEYVQKVDQFISSHKDSAERKYKLPSELWIPTDGEDFALPNLQQEPDFGDHVQSISKEDYDHWTEEEAKLIMRGRGSCNIEYLSILGQQIRHQLMDAIMFQMVKQKSFENPSQFRMLQFLVVRGITEVILEECGFEMRMYSAHVENRMSQLKIELAIGINEILDIYNLDLVDLVNAKALEQ